MTARAAEKEPTPPAVAPARDALVEGSAGRQWAQKTIAAKLEAPGQLPNIGQGYSERYRAAHAVHAIADRKLYTKSSRSGRRQENPMSRRDREFWRDVLTHAAQVKAEEN